MTVVLMARRPLIIGLATIGLFPRDALAKASGGPDAAATHVLILSNDYAGLTSPPPLKNTVRDGRLIESKLRPLDFKSLVHLSNAGLGTLQQTFASYLDRFDPGDISLVYIAGHGIQIEEQNYFVLNDGVTYLRLMSMIDCLRDVASTVVLLLDICRNNPFGIEQAPAPQARSVARFAPRARSPSGAEENMTIVVEDLRADPSRVSRRGDLTRIRGYDVAVIFATDPNNVALDGVYSDDLNSPFAIALASHLRDRLSLNSIIAQVGADMRSATQGRQAPWIQSSSTREIFLAGKPRNPTGVRPTP